MADKKPNDKQPPSLFDNLDLFAAKRDEAKDKGLGAADSGTNAPTLQALPPAGLTGTGPMQALYDFNF